MIIPLEKNLQLILTILTMPFYSEANRHRLYIIQTVLQRLKVLQTFYCSFFNTEIESY